jgi:hypothetical protein
MNIAKSQDVLGASVTRGSSQSEQMEVSGRYRAECLDAQGNVKWVEDFDNLVTTQGKNHLLDHGLAGPATAVIVRMSFITSGTPVVGDTYATHAGFTELGSGIIAARGTPSFSAASAGAKATSAAVSASIVGTGSVTGVAINLVVGVVGNLGVVADTATSGGILYSAGLFATAKSVSSGDTLNVTYTTTLT